MLIYLAYLQDEMHFMSERNDEKCKNNSQDQMSNSQKLTIVIREFEDFENDIANVALHFLEYFPVTVSIVVLADSIPYPPMQLPQSNRLQLVTLETDLSMEYNGQSLTRWIQSEYVLFVPDGVRLTQPSSNALSDLLKVRDALSNDGHVRMAAWPVDSSEGVQCLGLSVKLKHWTMQYYQTSDYCDAISGNFVLLMKCADLFKLAAPFTRPLREGLFIQTALRGWKVALQHSQMWKAGAKLYENPHNSWKHRTREHQHRKDLVKEFGIKLIQKPDGTEEWFGCDKDTERCFGTIHGNMPDYLHRGRWTPPCCLQALRTTARHVFRILERQKVRYWLEGGSLLGAVRNGDIIPWDYDVDLGMYADDLGKSMHLVNSAEAPYEAEDGFIWEKATEGDFYRIQYSSTNRLHVDIFPFFSHNGTMTKKTWFKSHRQDMPFPEHFLKPISKMPFVGVEVSVPNNAEKFLDMKFGEDVVANPRYPDMSKVSHIRT
jgi:hypothetical protein